MPTSDNENKFNSLLLAVVDVMVMIYHNFASGMFYGSQSQ